MTKKVEYVLQRTGSSLKEWVDFIKGNFADYQKDEFIHSKKCWQAREPQFSYRLLLRTTIITERVIE